MRKSVVKFLVGGTVVVGLIAVYLYGNPFKKYAFADPLDDEDDDEEYDYDDLDLFVDDADESTAKGAAD